MHRFVIALGLAGLLAGAVSAFADPAPASSGASIIEVKDHDALNKAWCAADPTIEHIIVLPASLFVDSEQMSATAGHL